VLEERLRFEMLLSAGLIHAAASAIDAALARVLQQVAMFLGVDRGSLDVYADQGAPRAGHGKDAGGIGWPSWFAWRTRSA
jgi:hypothetical protein